jgi:hypothetical protein
MNQCLKISIARGGCRFATPLYLGSSYVLSFEGARSDEAKKVLFVKPRSQNPDDTDGIVGLAESFVGEYGVTLSLDKSALVEWFKSNRACDVDSYVDAHCYVFNEDGEVLADSPVSIEYKPIDFVIDPTEFSKYSALLGRVVALEEKRISDKAQIDTNSEGIAELEEANEEMREQTASDIAESAKNTLISAKAYADLLRQMVAKIEYIRDVDASTEELDRYRKVEVGTKVVDGKQEIVLNISEELYTLEGGLAGENRYVYNDTSNIFGGDGTTNTFNTAVILNGITTLAITPSANDNSKKVVNSEWVNAKITASWTAHKDAFLAAENTWSGKQTFSGGIKGDLTGDVVGDVTGNVEGDLIGSVDVPEGGALTVVGTETHSGEETHSGDETHTGEVELQNVKSEDGSLDLSHSTSAKGVNQKYVWQMFKEFGAYFDGYWRIIFGDNIGYNTSKVTNWTGWRLTTQQAGLFLPEAETVSESGFYSASGLYKLDAPNLKVIEDQGFDLCTNLIELNVPKLERIGTWCFSGSASIPNAKFNEAFAKVKYAGGGAFAGMMQLTDVELPSLEVASANVLRLKTSTNLRSIEVGSEVPAERLGDPSLLDNVWDALWEALGNTNPTVPTEVTEYYTRNKLYELYPRLDEDFTVLGIRLYDCNALTSFIANNSQFIFDYVAYSSNILSTIEIKNSLFIGSYAFSAIGQGKTVSNPGASFYGGTPNLNIEKCRFIAPNAFTSTSDSYWVYSAKTIKADELLYIGRAAFYMNESLKGFYAPKLKAIGADAFHGCHNLVGSYYENDDGNTTGDLTVLNFPECEYIGNTAFNGRTSHMLFTEINIPKCTFIGTSAFNDCTALKDIYLYGYDYNKLMSAVSGWALSTTAYTRNPDGTHTGVAIHATYTDGRKCVVAYTSSAWRFQHYED